MTEQEYNAIIAEQSLEISKAREAEVEARRKISDAREEFCESLAERYADYIGRKVEIAFSIPGSNREEKEVKTVTGYLYGFQHKFVRDVFCPFLLKSRKTVLQAAYITQDGMLRVINIFLKSQS